MRVAIYLPFLAAAAIGVSAPHLARRLPPPSAVRLITGGAAATALACAFSLGVLAFLTVGHVPPLAALGHWSAQALQADSHVPLAASLAGLVGAAAAVWLLLRALRHFVLATVNARMHCARIGGEPGRLVVVDSDRPDAYALSARHGRVVVTRRLLQDLSSAERRALLAHEHAHLEHGHHRFRLAVALSAALCPLLRPARRAVDFATERWADEAAAAEVGDRRLVATTLTRTSILVGAGPTARPALAIRAALGPVVHRVQALLEPPPRQRPVLLVAALTLMVVVLAAVLDVRSDTEHLLETAFTAWNAGR